MLNHGLNIIKEFREQVESNMSLTICLKKNDSYHKCVEER